MKYGKVLTNSKMRISLADQGRLEEGGSGWATADPCFSCATLIRYSKATVQTLGSGHENLGLSDATSEYI